MSIYRFPTHIVKNKSDKNLLLSLFRYFVYMHDNSLIYDTECENQRWAPEKENTQTPCHGHRTTKYTFWSKVITKLQQPNHETFQSITYFILFRLPFSATIRIYTSYLTTFVSVKLFYEVIVKKIAARVPGSWLFFIGKARGLHVTFQVSARPKR